jgi:cell division septum initiation protein DivIVA
MTQQTPAFRTVMRGYEPGEVDRAISELRKALDQTRAESGDSTVAVTKLRSQVAQLEEQANAYRLRLATLEQEQKDVGAKPTYADLGARIGKMLKLAEDEAAELVAKAKAEAEKLVSEATAAADATRTAADRYGADVTSKADAESTRALEAAKRQSDEILDYADREATARREEAEAVYEHQRARAAAAAADFEKTLAVRRDKAAEEFAVQMQVNEQAIIRAQERQAALDAEADRTLAEARQQAELHLKGAREEAGSHVDSARLTAEKIRRESERELQAATSRRDAITAQLTNVRQMLATLGGVAIVNPLAEPEAVTAPAQQQAAESPEVEESAADEAEATDEIEIEGDIDPQPGVEEEEAEAVTEKSNA